ncbi:MAG: response regulator transcription factor [Bacteroidota bacterium]|nr:response regulator transcription factor [Bacteroidota bacterium]
MKQEKKIKIIMADDHPLFRNGLRQVIEEDENILILGEADNGQSALDLINEFNPDIALLDIDMPEKTGLEVLRELKNFKQKPKVIFLSVFADEDIYDEAMELGISGYVLKDSAVSDIIDCIYKVSKGDYYISQSLMNLLVNKKTKIKFSDDSSFIRMLTKAEIMILKLVSEGRTTKEIAEMLDISFKTAENHRTNISNKLQLKGSNSLIKFAIENKAHLF